jgi:hypothetical protein
VIGAVCFDAVGSNMENKVISHYGASQSELISMIYTIGAVVIGVRGLLNSDRKQRHRPVFTFLRQTTAKE